MQTTRFVTKPSPVTNRILLVAGILVGLLPVLVFWVSVQGEFVAWDDDINISGNPHLQEGLGGSLAWAWTDLSHVRRYMPLGWTGWILNYQLDGLAPATYHLGNVLLHGANAVLLFGLILQLLQAVPGQKPMTTRRWIWLYLSAGLASLLWAVHPLRVEPVAWASGRLYGQAMFFLLISFNCYLAYARRIPHTEPNRKLYWAAVAAFGASLLTYPMALTALLIFPLLDWYPLRRWGGHRPQREEMRPVWKEKIPLAVLAGVVGLLTLSARWLAGEGWNPPPSLEAFGYGERVMQAFYIWCYYLWRQWWPMELSPLYGTLVSFDPQAAKFWVSVWVVVVLSLLAWFTRRRWPGFAVLWVSYLVLLIPVLGLTEHPHYPSDRYSYMVGITWSIVLGALLWGGFETLLHRRIVFLTCLVLAGMFGLHSYRQCLVWRNSESLFQHMIVTLKDDPIRFDAYHRLGDHYLRQARFGEAEYCFREELALKPANPRALLSLGNALVLQERWDAAVGQYRRLLEMDPGFKQGWLNLGLTLVEAGRFEEAVGHYEEALRSISGDVDLILAAAKAARLAGQFDKALEYYGKLSGRDSGLVEAVVLGTARTLVEAGRAVEGRALLEAAWKEQQRSLELTLELAWLLATHPDEAIRDAPRALELGREANRLAGRHHGRALDVLAAAHANSDQYEEAVRWAGEAVEAAATAEQQRAIRARLELYRRERAVRAGPGRPSEP